MDYLEVFEEQLEGAGIATPQIHVLTSHDAESAHHEHLNRVASFMKKDVVHSALIGALIGVCASVFILWVAYISGWTESAAGRAPFVFLSIVLSGFCTWEGGLFGIQRPNFHFARFEQTLKDDKHIFFVDLHTNQEEILDKGLQKHSRVELAGTEVARNHWIIESQKKVS